MKNVGNDSVLCSSSPLAFGGDPSSCVIPAVVGRDPSVVPPMDSR